MENPRSPQAFGGGSTTVATSDAPKSDDLKYIVVSFVRHGQSVANLKRSCIQHKEDGLTAEGLQQAKELGEKWANIRIDALYSSDLKRAVDTAEALAEYNRNRPELTQWACFREHDFGPVVEGFMAQGDNNAAWLERTGKTSYDRGPPRRDHRPTDGESVDDLVERAIRGLLQVVERHGVALPVPPDELLTEYRPTGEYDELPDGVPHVVIVSHNIFLAELWEALSSWNSPQHRSSDAHYPNAGWSRHIIRRKGWAGGVDGFYASVWGQLDFKDLSKGRWHFD